MKKWIGGAVKLAEESLREKIRGKKIALMINATAIMGDGRLLLDVIVEEKWADVAFILGMEHGVRCNFQPGEHDEAGIDEKTGIPVISLYDFPERRPPVSYLSQVDAVVYCTQDSGVRHWTFTPWMIYLVDAAAQAGCEMIVLDRPNPIRGDIVEGNIPDAYVPNLLCGFDYPLRHGMTVGELAYMYNEEKGIGAKLTVLKMEGWKRDMWYDETGLLWLPPTPNMPTPDSFLYFCTVGLMQGSNISFGRMSTTPYQFIGLPAFSSEELATELNSRDFDDVYFVPKFNMATTVDSQKTPLPCNGVLITIRDRDSFRAVRTQLHIMDALQKLYAPDKWIFDFKVARFWARKRLGTDELHSIIERGESPLALLDKWEADAVAFEERRRKYLLY